MEVRNSAFGAFIDVFTPNTYVMVIMSDSSIRKYTASLWVAFAVRHLIAVLAGEQHLYWDF